MLRHTACAYYLLKRQVFKDAITHKKKAAITSCLFYLGFEEICLTLFSPANFSGFRRARRKILLSQLIFGDIVGVVRNFTVSQ